MVMEMLNSNFMMLLFMNVDVEYMMTNFQFFWKYFFFLDE